MRIASVIGVLSVLAAATLPIKAEGLNPSIKVDIPYTVMVGSQRLSPGEYVIREASDLSDIFAVYKSDGKFETYVHGSPVEQLNASPQTDVVLRSNGHEYVMDQIWFEGDSTGFQFYSPNPVNSRQEEQKLPAAKRGF